MTTKKISVLSKKEKPIVPKQSKSAIINKLKNGSSSKLGASATDAKKVGKKIRINLRDKIDVEVVDDSDEDALGDDDTNEVDDDDAVDALDDNADGDTDETSKASEVVSKTKDVVKTGRGKKTKRVLAGKDPKNKIPVNLSGKTKTVLKKKDPGAKETGTKNSADNNLDAADDQDSDAKDSADDQDTADDQDVKDVKDDTDNLDDKIQMPALEMVSDALKERYEYKPILRSEIVYVRPEDRITSEVMTIFEYCEVVSVRAKQIENGGVVFTDIGDLTDPLEIARLEVANKRCPIDIVRMITDIVAERWHVNEMAIPHHA
jgi:DNA-directed RNA polymerase I, II, and III subunit RPABC2